MSLWRGFFLLATFWCLVHIIHHFKQSKSSSSLLPLQLSSRTRTSTTNISLHSLQLKIFTTRWNSRHDELSSALSRRGNKTLSAALRWFYDLGSVSGAIGMLVALAGLLWIFVTSGLTLFNKISAHGIDSSSHGQTLLKRTLETLADNTPNSHPPLVTAIIPGITVPLSHLPLIICAVFLSQIIHELGHALAAARESLPMTAAGASFTICFPAAFVTFPTVGMKALSPQARSRVTAAGAFHNLVFWCFLVVVLRSGVANLASYVSGYRNVSDLGKVVVDVDQDSPLSLHLTKGVIITRLDDNSLAFPRASDSFWTEYLTSPGRKSSIGWCIPRTFLEKSDSCCSPATLTSSPLACFVSMDGTEHGCIDPVPVLTKPRGRGRCTSQEDCSPDSSCVAPDKTAQLLRLTVQPSVSEDETVVLWNGPPREIWEAVIVGNWLPRAPLFPLWIPFVVQDFWEYLTMATLSLYFFNLLPIPHLDGSELLQSFVDLAFPTQRDGFIYDVEALESDGGDYEGPRKRRRWKALIVKCFHVITTVLVASCILITLLNSMIS
ncbi:hypothetical protein M413DRAFT_18068 [Hebeloma cylindrosporum]|uniref:Endopeptidase S2P n=1 Tax=Hebeloma cylindrosporum TaxID=76867 RepID=A0A0C3CHM2_HEBCY|nr:hypothetical protein M413DRAFT_18068 [Hebeloma cylindrosporum h7]